MEACICPVSARAGGLNVSLFRVYLWRFLPATLKTRGAAPVYLTIPLLITSARELLKRELVQGIFARAVRVA